MGEYCKWNTSCIISFKHPFHTECVWVLLYSILSPFILAIVHALYMHSFPQALKRQCHDKVFFGSCVDALGLINKPRTSFTFFQSSIDKLQFILNCLIFWFYCLEWFGSTTETNWYPGQKKYLSFFSKINKFITIYCRSTVWVCQPNEENK